MRKVWQDFKAFAFKSSLIELATAFILGAAFATVVQSLVEDIFSPLIAALFGKRDFSRLRFEVGDGVVTYGNFLTALVGFLLVALALFLVIRGYQRATRARKSEPESPAIRQCPHCFTDISARASRCPNCTSEIQPQVT